MQNSQPPQYLGVAGMYLCVCILFSVILHSILLFLPHFFITGFCSVISLQSDKAVISPVEESHNSSEISWPVRRLLPDLTF